MDEIESWKIPDIFANPLWIGKYPGDLKDLRRKTLGVFKCKRPIKFGS